MSMFDNEVLREILPVLLKDRTTEKNIIFACSDQYKGIKFYTEIIDNSFCFENIILARKD